MPFSKYLQDGTNDNSPSFTDALQFQIPAFMHLGAPTLAPGGGAEVVPYNSTWLANSGFTQSYTPVSSASPKPNLLPVSAPSPLGLPVYSASGFDVLSALARVVTRPNPRVALGPVDLTCSFVVVDVRRHDHPIVYCSPTFCRLTGYDEHEILGRNCRFLQAPGGVVRRGEQRRFTSQQSVNLLRKALSADKEVQTSIVNFRKDGTAFINLVSVIPITGGVSGGKHELNDIVYHVGFQVDLNQQPNLILEKLRDGTYIANQPRIGPAPLSNEQPVTHRRTYTLPTINMSPTLATLLQSKSFLRSFPITTTTTAPVPLPASGNLPLPGMTNHVLSLLILEYAPDFIHVVSLKGAFLYVAPSVTRVLGYTPSELLGKSMADLAHPEDVVPLERQLKESSTLLPSSPLDSSSSPSHSHSHSHDQGLGPVHARTIDVLFRARTKNGVYVWVECRGRLHVEPGKGRKAIILSGRARAMPKVAWGDVVRASGGLAAPVRVGTDTEAPEWRQREFWAQLAGKGHGAGAMVSVGRGIGDVLGYTPEELIGRRIGTLAVEGQEAVREALRVDGEEARTASVWARLRTKMGGAVRVLLVFYRSGRGGLDPTLRVSPAPVLVQVRLLDGASPTGASPIVHPLDANIFAELEVSRGSSWQYELQQLRFANRRLKEEVAELERELEQQERAQESSTSLDTSAESATLGYPDLLPSEMGMGMVDMDMSLGMGMADHANYAIALERYTGRPDPVPTPRPHRDAFELMPAPIAVPARPYHQFAPVPPPRAPTPARIPPEQRRPGVSMHQLVPQAMYAPVPMPAMMQRGRPSLMHAMGLQGRAPSRMEAAQVESMQGASQQIPLLQMAHDWGTLHQGMKRPLER